MMRIDVVTLFPEMISCCMEHGVVGRALKRELVQLKCWNPRDYTTDRHRTVDDRSYGGGPGMVMKVEPLRSAIEAASESDSSARPVVYLSPQGRRFDQQAARRFAQGPGMILLAGRYEGIDQRLIEAEVDEEWSIGDYVLSGGELAAAVMMDAITRLLPGALGDAESAQQDSFMNGLLDCPHYTRPENYEGREVPAVLLSGDHAAIARWRLRESLGQTWLKRPDLLAKKQLDNETQALLDDFIREYERGNAQPVQG